MPYLVVRAGTSFLALPTPPIKRVLQGVRIHPLPGLDPRISGLARFGGEALVVYSTETLLGAPYEPYSGELSLVIIDYCGEDVGLAVREALEVVAIQHSPDGATPALAEAGEFRRIVKPIQLEDLFAGLKNTILHDKKEETMQ